MTCGAEDAAAAEPAKGGIVACASRGGLVVSVAGYLTAFATREVSRKVWVNSPNVHSTLVLCSWGASSPLIQRDEFFPVPGYGCQIETNLTSSLMILPDVS